MNLEQLHGLPWPHETLWFDSALPFYLAGVSWAALLRIRENTWTYQREGAFGFILEGIFIALPVPIAHWCLRWAGVGDGLFATIVGYAFLSVLLFTVPWALFGLLASILSSLTRWVKNRLDEFKARVRFRTQERARVRETRVLDKRVTALRRGKVRRSRLLAWVLEDDGWPPFLDHASGAEQDWLAEQLGQRLMAWDASISEASFQLQFDRLGRLRAAVATEVATRLLENPRKGFGAAGVHCIEWLLKSRAPSAMQTLEKLLDCNVPVEGRVVSGPWTLGNEAQAALRNFGPAALDLFYERYRSGGGEFSRSVQKLAEELAATDRERAIEILEELLRNGDGYFLERTLDRLNWSFDGADSELQLRYLCLQPPNQLKLDQIERHGDEAVPLLAGILAELLPREQRPGRQGEDSYVAARRRVAASLARLGFVPGVDKAAAIFLCEQGRWAEFLALRHAPDVALALYGQVNFARVIAQNASVLDPRAWSEVALRMRKDAWTARSAQQDEIREALRVLRVITGYKRCSGCGDVPDDIKPGQRCPFCQAVLT